MAQAVAPSGSRAIDAPAEAVIQSFRDCFLRRANGATQGCNPCFDPQKARNSFAQDADRKQFASVVGLTKGHEMNLKMTAAAAIAALMMAGGAQASQIYALDDIGHCEGGSNTNVFSQGNVTTDVTIDIGDVTGNVGGATDCWGAAQGNDSQITKTNTDGTSGFSIGGKTYFFVSKIDINTGDDDKYTGQDRTGTDIGLKIADDDGNTDNLPSSSGKWSVDATKFAPYGDFLISLKAANNPGYAVWLFSGDDAASTFGT